MTGDVEVLAPAGARLGTEPATGGRIDRLLALPARLPGPDLGWILALVPLLWLLLSAPAWLTGAIRPGTILTEAVGPSVLAAYLLGAITVLNRIAHFAYHEFRPALGPGRDHARDLAALVRLPDGAALVGIAIAEVVVTAGFLSDEAALRRFLSHPPAVAFGQAAAWALAIAAAALVIVHTVRQLRAVGRLHAAATVIDLFEPRSIIAFSRLTSATAIGLLIVPLLILASATVEGVTDASGFEVAQHVAIVTLAVATFLIPLLGMHDRMMGEKGRLSHEVHERLRATLARIHAGVDDDDLAAADKRHSTLTSLLAERDMVARLPTWPWSPGLLTGFASAVLLPIGILLLSALVDRVL